MEAHIGALDVAPGAYLSGHAQTLGGGQMSDTMKAIDIVAKLRVIDEMLAEQGVPDAQVDIHLEFDDVVLFDHGTGAEAQRFKGKV